MARTTTAASSVLDPSVVTEIQKPATSIKRTTTEVTEVLPAAAPPSESERVGGRDLEAFFETLRDSEWGDYTYYLYRLSSRTMQNELQKARPGDSYLCKVEPEEYHAAFHDGWVGFQEWVKAKFGGGWFRLRVNSRKSAGDGTAMSGGTRSRCVNEFSIEGDPKYCAKEISAGITGQPASSEQGTLLPLVRDLLEQVKRGSADPAVALKEAMQMAASMNNQFVEMFKTQIPQQSSPEDQLTKLVKAIETLGYTRPGAAAAEPPAAAVNPLASAREALQMLKEFGLIGRELEPVEEKTFAEQLEEALHVAKLVTPAPVGGGKMSGWDALAQVLPSLIEKGLPVIRDMWDRAITAKMAIAAPAPASPGPTIIPQERTAVVVAGAEAIPNPPPATADTQSAVLNWLSSKLIEFVQLGVPPEDVAHWLGMSDPKTCSLLAALGREKVLEFIGTHPILKVLKDDPRLPKFVDGFLEALKPETDEDDSQPGGKPN